MLLPFAPPFVLGSDLAGKVVEIGHAVTSLRVGNPVYAYAGMDRMGAFAESVVLPADHVARRPGALSVEEAVRQRSAEGPGLRITVDEVFRFEARGAATDRVQSGKAKGRVVLKRG